MTLSGALDLELDGSLRFAFTVTNDGDGPVELRFRDGQRAEFSLIEGGEERWRFGEGRAFTQALGRERLASGESVTYDGEWSGPEPGEYTALAVLCAENVDCRVERAIAVSGENLSSDPP